MRTKQNRNTWLFVGFLLFGGIANLLSRMPGLELSTLMACLNYLIFVGLLLFWIESVRVRFLPSAARSSILSAALLLLLYMLIRIFKYRFAVATAVARYAAYAYWIPQMLVPALFLITCIRIRRGEQAGRKQYETLLLIPGCILALAAMTNDLHGLVYRIRISLAQFEVQTGAYTYGPVFYLLYAWMILTIPAGLIILFRETGRLEKTAIMQLIGVVVLWFGFVLLNILFLDKHADYRLFNVPEAHTFGLLGVFEVCIRHRLIPYNENYAGFFHALQLPVLITDREFKPAYSSEIRLIAEEKDLKAALSGPVPLTDDQKLHGREIRAGYAFWAEDESGVRRAQERLLEANETIEQENDLIRAETEQKEKDAYLQSRHRIYHEIAAELYPVQKKIGELLESAGPGTDGFRDMIAAVSILNAYVKRKTNILLLAAGNELLSLRELFLALQESANYFTIAGLRATAQMPEDQLLPAEIIARLYDAFELIAEQLKGKAPSMMVSWNRNGLRIAAETDLIPDTEKITLPVRFLKSENILYIDIPAGEEALS